MNQSILITPRVLQAINALPMDERVAVVSAIAGEMFLGHAPGSALSPMETIIYSMIRSYIQHDSQRLA